MSSWRTSPGRHTLPHFLRILVVACGLLQHPAGFAQTKAIETGELVLPVEVTVNGGSGGIWPIVSRDGVLYAPVEAFGTWRLQVRPDTPAIEYRGFRYLPVGAVTGVESRLDTEKATLDLTVAAEAFSATRLARELASVYPRTPVVPAVFVNYDLNFSRIGGPVPTRGLGLLGEVGSSGSWGVFTQSFVASNLIEGDDRGLTRLETSFRRDFPEQGYTLVAGDSVFRTGLLGRSAYFGGLQFGTNFGLAPHINRQPIPLIAGETSTPSTVQLYVNDVLRQTSNVPAGPFALDNLPVLSGNGDVTVRVRDILGRETLITQPFLISADLLARDLTDWSVEVGKLRLGLGSESSRYGTPFAAGMVRRGLSNTTTAEARLEMADGHSAGGLAGVHAIGSSWLLRAGAMASRHDTLGSGRRWILGAERPGYVTTLGATLEGNSRGFRSLGEDEMMVPPKLQFAAQATWAATWGRVGLALAHQRQHDGEGFSSYSLNYGTTLRRNWQLNTYYTRVFGRADGYTVGVVLVVPLDRHTSTATSVQVQNDRTEFYTNATHAPAGPTGWAWRALAAHQGEARAEAGVNYLSPYGMFTAEAAARPQQADVRLGAVGAAVWTQSRVFALPRFDDSAVLVSVPGQQDVGVGLGAQTTQRTDADGFALINRLAPYQKNPIRLDANDLPLSAEIDSIEQEVVPPWRSVSKVEFAVRGGRAALISIEMEDGQPAPPGATVRIEGEDRDFYVARRGEAYITGLKPADNRLQMEWQGKRCMLDLALRADGPEIVRAGPLRCKGVAR